ncbi:usg protein [Futiania mangrovi]|uniref:Usg protein n=1 Tax=Futiania mangrovi TaxID=2959716 RepID=A0A9J6PG53_9PROT|nr:Usg family protein [Futiania mangrovii]MCP1335090.1 usg protein [Futiania mangrovii]
MTEMQRLLQGYRMTTAEILYHMPDHPHLLQSFIWQQLDLAPKFPVLTRFLDFWTHNLDGKLHSVRVGTMEIVRASDFSHAQGEWVVH